jgi:hypothetical protein
LNLIDFGFQNSNLFQHMPLFDEITYLGVNEEKVRQYKAIREDQACKLLALNFIRKDEEILWGAIEDLLKRSTTNAVSSVHGLYSFDLLTIDIHKELKTYKHAELSTLIVNTAIKLPLAGIKMVKYSSVYAFMRKQTQEDWGKIVFKSAVHVFNDKPEYLDLLIKKILKDFQFPADPVILLLNDLSLNPVFGLNNQTQQSRLQKVMQDLIPTSIEFIPEVYIQDKSGARELLSGSRL